MEGIMRAIQMPEKVAYILKTLQDSGYEAYIAIVPGNGI